MKKLILTSLSLFLLSACSSYNSSRGPVSASLINIVDPATEHIIQSSSFSSPEIRQSRLEEIEKSLNIVLNYCYPILSGFEVKSESQANAAYWLSMSGLVAGSVISPALLAANPAANAASIAALSSWAGATNFANKSLITSGLSGAESANRRNTIVGKVGDQIQKAISAFSEENDTDGENSFKKAKLALFNAQAGCILYKISAPNTQDVPVKK